MPRIRTVPPEAATDHLADAYEVVRDAAGVPAVPTVFQLSSIRPDLASLLAHQYAALFGRGELSHKAKEAISTYVSALNACPYCVGVHGLLMQRDGASDAQVQAARAGDVTAFTDDEEIARFLPLAETITRHAYKLTDDDVEGLRAAGWTDEKILEAVWIVAFFNMVNRLADSLGIAEADFHADVRRVAEAAAT